MRTQRPACRRGHRRCQTRPVTRCLRRAGRAWSAESCLHEHGSKQTSATQCLCGGAGSASRVREQADANVAQVVLEVQKPQKLPCSLSTRYAFGQTRLCQQAAQPCPLPGPAACHAWGVPNYPRNGCRSDTSTLVHLTYLADPVRTLAECAVVNPDTHAPATQGRPRCWTPAKTRLSLCLHPLSANQLGHLHVLQRTNKLRMRTGAAGQVALLNPGILALVNALGKSMLHEGPTYRSVWGAHAGRSTRQASVARLRRTASTSLGK